MPATVGFALPTTSVSVLTAPLASAVELAEMDPIQLAIEVARTQLYHVCLLATAYWLSARIGHRTQLAASALPPAPPPTPKSQRSKRLHTVLFLVLFAALLVGEYAFISSTSITTVAGLTTTFVALTLLFHVAVMILSISPGGKTLVDWELVRSPGTGVPTARIDRSKSSRRQRLFAVLGATTLAGAYSYYAFVQGEASHAFRQIGGAAYIAMIGARAFARTMSIRMAIIGFLIFEAFTLLVMFFSIAATAYLDSPNSPPTDSDSRDTTEQALSMLSQIACLVPALYASLNAFLIVLCWRFDYSNHPSSSSSSRPTIELRQDANGNPCASVPSTTPTGFPKPYFATALILTLASHVAAPILVVYLAVHSPFEREGDDVSDLVEGPLRDLTAGWLAGFIAGPVAGGGVVILALLRGEGKKVWSYTEEWIKKEADEGPAGDRGAQVGYDEHDRLLIKA